MRIWVIYSKSEKGFWNNSDGWGAFATASRYTTEEKEATPHIPMGGQWEHIEAAKTLPDDPMAP